MARNPMKRIQFFVTEQEYNEISKRADQECRSLSEMVRIMVREWIESEGML